MDILLNLMDGLERNFMKWPVGYVIIAVLIAAHFGSKKANEIQR